MLRRLIFPVILGVVLQGCVGPHVLLKHPEKGLTVDCTVGSHPWGMWGGILGELGERNCIEKHKKMGYQRVQ